MFILKKILGTGNNIPDLIKLPAKAGDYMANTPLVLNGDRILTNSADNEMPTYMSTETRTIAKDGDLLTCYRILPNMMFETHLAMGEENLYLGQTLFAVKTYGSKFVNSVAKDDVPGNVSVADTNNAKNQYDHIYIVFDS